MKRKILLSGTIFSIKNFAIDGKSGIFVLLKKDMKRHKVNEILKRLAEDGWTQIG